MWSARVASAMILLAVAFSPSADAETDAERQARSDAALKVFMREVRPVWKRGCKDAWDDRTVKRMTKTCDRIISNPGGLTDRQRGYAYYVRGMSLRSQDMVAEALADFDQAIPLIPEQPHPYYERGVVHERLGNKTLAATDYQKSLDVGYIGAEYPLRKLREACPSLMWEGTECKNAIATPLPAAIAPDGPLLAPPTATSEAAQQSWFEWRPWRRGGTAAKSPPTISKSDIANAKFLVMETSKGKVLVKLRPDLAPKHVERVKQLAQDGFYNGNKFHRVVPGYMAQTGDPTGTGKGKSTYPDLPAELSAEPIRRGTVAAAREVGLGPDSVNSANSQFFICSNDTYCALLIDKYTIWGNVLEGMDAIDHLAAGEPPADPDTVLNVVLQSGTEPVETQAAPSPGSAPNVAVATPDVPSSDLPPASAPGTSAPISLACPIGQELGGWVIRGGTLDAKIPVLTVGNSATHSGTKTKWSADGISLEMLPQKNGQWITLLFVKNLKHAGAPMHELEVHWAATVWDVTSDKMLSVAEAKNGGGTIYNEPYTILTLPEWFIGNAIDKIETSSKLNIALDLPKEDGGGLIDVIWINPFKTSGLRAAMTAAQACALN